MSAKLFLNCRVPRATKQAAFLDRDGVINYDKNYVHRWEDFEFLPGVIDGLELLEKSGYELFVITNQSGLARGLFSLSEYHELTNQYVAFLAKRNIHISAVYYCPHHPCGTVEKWAKTCGCRKPAPGLLLKAKKEHGLDLKSSILIGDKLSDIEAAHSAGVGNAFLVDADAKCSVPQSANLEVVESLLEAAKRVAK